MASSEDSHIITVTSSACTDIFPNNSPWSFTNKIGNVIQLNPNLSYEAALINIYFPKEYYGITKNDEDSTVAIIFNFGKGNYHIDYFKPEYNVISGDISYIVALINKQVRKVVTETPLGVNASPYILEEGSCLNYKAATKRVYIELCVNEDKIPNDNLISITLKFGTRVADVLGFSPDKKYPIYLKNNNKDITRYGNDRIYAPFPSSLTSGVDFVFVYSDIVERTHFGGNKVNILDILQMHEGNARGYHNLVYYPVSTKTIDTISIRLADQKGRNIYFKQNTTTICVLHIKSTGMA